MTAMLNRRTLCQTLAATFALSAAALPVQAQTAAEKALANGKFTMVAPFPPGGPIDSLARIISDGLGKRYNQPAIVDNAPGAAGNIGMDKVKRAKPDGHTLLTIPAGNLTINPTLMPNFPFNISQDFTPIAMLATTPNLLVAHPDTGLKNLPELIAKAKPAGSHLSYGSPGVGSGLHLAGELFKSQAQIDLLHVAYKGTAPALNDLLGGTIPLMFSNLPAVLPYLENGKLVALGITDAQRSPLVPQVPTFAEQGVAGVVVPSWYGLLAPAGVSKEVAEQLARDVHEILAQPQIKDSLKIQGLVAWDMRNQAFADYIAQETANWAKVIKARNISVQ